MTKCTDPSAIAEGDLLAYVAGQSGPAVQAHLRRCAYCAERAIALRRLDRRLLAGQYRAACPTPLELARWQVRLAPAGEATRIAAHVRTCPHCARELGELAAVDEE